MLGPVPDEWNEKKSKISKSSPSGINLGAPLYSLFDFQFNIIPSGNEKKVM